MRAGVEDPGPKLPKSAVLLRQISDTLFQDFLSNRKLDMAAKKAPAKKPARKTGTTSKAAAKKAPAKSKKTAARAVVVKKTTGKKKTVAKKPAATPARKLTAVSQKYTRSAILGEIAENTELSRKQVKSVLDELGMLIERHVKKRSVGEFTLPGLLKIKVVNKPRRPAKKGVPNPFRPGETMDVAAKPASRRVKILPLKGLKVMAE